MDTLKIKKYYKIFGYINLILVMLFLIISVEIELMDRIIGAVIIVFLYHILYLFFSSISRKSTQNKFNTFSEGILLKLFSILGILSAVMLLYFLYLRL